MMGVMFGGPNARKTGTYKALGYSLQYVNHEPALVLWRLAALNSALVNDSAAYVICLSAAHKYRSDNQRNLRENFRNFINATRVLGLNALSKADVHMVVDACEHLLHDLVSMKPEPLGGAEPNVETTVGDHRLHIETLH